MFNIGKIELLNYSCIYTRMESWIKLR